MTKTVIGSALATLAATSALTAPCPKPAELATQFGVYKPVGMNLLPLPATPFTISEDEKIRSLRVLVRRLPTAGPSWTVTIRDRLGRPLQSISSRHINDNEPFWTDRFPTNSLEFNIEASPGSTAAPLRGVEYVGISREAERPYYSIQGEKPTWVDLYTGNVDSPLLQRRGDSIGMFIGHEGNAVQGMSIWTCTGFVIARDPAVLFVTNDHCGGNWRVSTDRWTPSVCPNAVVDFSWDGDSVPREYVCKEVMARSPDHDIAILKLEAVKPEPAPAPLTIRSAPLMDEAVSMIHHPSALKKQASIKCPATTGVNVSTVKMALQFAHRCDSEGGSSGAPVLDGQGRVAGVHHMGFENLNTTTCDMLNKAVHSEKLIKLLKETPALTGYQID